MRDRTLILAMKKVLDRVALALGQHHDVIAARFGGVVSIFLAHPSAVDLADDLQWRRLLARWRSLRAQVGPAPSMSADDVTSIARALLVEAAHDAARVEASAA
jgi:hypothetical protein